MQCTIKVSLLALALTCFSALGVSSIAAIPQPCKTEAVTLSAIGTGMHLLAWDAMAGRGAYTVSVFNMTTQTLHSTSTTTSTSKVLNGLVVGNTYRFSIQRAGTIVIVDNIVN